MPKLKAPFVCPLLISSISQYQLPERKKTTSTLKRGVPKITQLFINTTINPHLTNLPQSSSNAIKDSALNIVSLNIRSLTIKEDSIKLKRLFSLDAVIIVLTEVSVNGSAYNRLCRLWRQQISRYQVWYTGTDYRGIMILV